MKQNLYFPRQTMFTFRIWKGQAVLSVVRKPGHDRAWGSHPGSLLLTSRVYFRQGKLVQSWDTLILVLASLCCHFNIQNTIRDPFTLFLLCALVSWRWPYILCNPIPRCRMQFPCLEFELCSSPRTLADSPSWAPSLQPAPTTTVWVSHLASGSSSLSWVTPDNAMWGRDEPSPLKTARIADFMSKTNACGLKPLKFGMVYCGAVGDRTPANFA